MIDRVFNLFIVPFVLITIWFMSSDVLFFIFFIKYLPFLYKIPTIFPRQESYQIKENFEKKIIITIKTNNKYDYMIIVFFFLNTMEG